jgi:hypothetical protein
MQDQPPEILRKIAEYLDIRAIGRFGRISRAVRAAIDPELYVSKIELRRRKRVNRLRYDNPHWAMISANLDKPWNWKIISESKYITYDIIKNNSTLAWSLNHICVNTNFTMDIIMELFGKQWRSLISLNPNITINDVLMYPDEAWDYTWLTYCSAITLDEVVRFAKNKPWDWSRFTSRYAKTFDILLKYPTVPWDWSAVTLSKETFDDIIKHADLVKCWRSISKHRGLKLDYVIANPLNSWDWEMISVNPNSTLDIILSNPDLPWNASVVMNPHVYIRDILKHPILQKSYVYLSTNPNITIEDVLENPNLPWEYTQLSAHRNITLDIILAHPELPWRWDWISINPNITMDMVVKHPKIPWAWDVLFRFD